MFARKKPENIRKKSIIKRYNIQGTHCSICVKDAIFGEIDGEVKLLDEPVVDRMFHDICKSINNNCSKYNPPPKTVIISHEEENTDNASCHGTDKIINEKNADCEGILDCYDPHWSMDDVKGLMNPGSRYQLRRWRI